MFAETETVATAYIMERAFINGAGRYFIVHLANLDGICSSIFAPSFSSPANPMQSLTSLIDAKSFNEFVMLPTSSIASGKMIQKNLKCLETRS